MAKEEKRILTPEEKKREKEILDKEKEERANIEKIKKGKEKRRKLKEKKLKLEQKKEIKRIKSLVRLPYRIHFQVTLLATMFSVIFLFFWLDLDLKDTIIYLFLIFTFFYFGIGMLMVGVFFMLGEDKKREYFEHRRLESERLAMEERIRLDEENLKLQELERDIAEMKNDTIRTKELESSHKSIDALPSSSNLSDEDIENMDFPQPLMLSESSEAIDDDFINSLDEPDIYNYINSDLSVNMPEDEDFASHSMETPNYFEEIMSPDYNPNNK